MKLNKILMVIGLLMTIGGFVFTLLTHDMHYLIGSVVTLGDHNHDSYSHDEHKTWGYIFAAIGLASLTIGWKNR